MALASSTAILFGMLFPEIEIVYANPTTVNETVMNQVPQWRGCKAILDTMDARIIESVRQTTPKAHLINETGLLDALNYVPVVQN